MPEVVMREVIEQSFQQYAGAVLQSRALVDARDMIKPSARQIFYCLAMDGFTHDKPFQKTLKAIGSGFKTYIHGDSSLEGILMRAGQPFNMRYPLTEIEGSYGNPMESGNWAASRYTSTRLSKIANYLFEDIKKNTIEEWRDNYDDTMQYPTVLPSKGFFNLVNGSFGLGIALSSSIPQYNLKDLNKALIYLLNNPNCSFEDIYCAPDFASGAILLNESEVKESMKKGHGKSCLLRSKISYDEKDNCLVVTEIPYGVYTNTICKQLESILEDEANPGIERFNDLTSEHPNIKIYLKKGTNPEKIKQYLYTNTSLQYFYGINFTMLGNNGRFPRNYTWKELLQEHIDHEKQVYRRGFEFDLHKIQDRLHIINGILIVIANLEEVIEIIKNSSSINEASKNLQDKFLLDETQIKAVLAIKLSQLAKLEVRKYEDEKEYLESEKTRIETILNDESLFKKEIENGFLKVSKEFGDERRTQVFDFCETDNEEIIEHRNPEENCIILMTESGLIKRIPSTSFKTQKRNAAGVKTQDGIISSIIRTNTIDTLLVFSDKGKMYHIPVSDIPEGANASKGVSIKSMVNMTESENPSILYSIYQGTEAKYVLFVTKNGTTKKTPLEDYITSTKRKGNISAISLREDDELAAVNLIKEEELLIVTKKGNCIRFNSTDIPSVGRNAIGVKGINLKETDEVVAVLPVRDKEDNLIIFTSNGMGKQVKISDFTLQKRGGVGIACYKTNANAHVISAVCGHNGDKLLVRGKTKGICIEVEQIPISSRISTGVQIIKEGSIIGVSKI